MSNFKNKDILIYRSDHLYVEHIDDRIEGDLNKVVWNDLDKITDALVNIISAAGGKTEAVSYFSICERNTVQVGKRITTQFNENNIDIEPLTTSFLREITKSDNFSGELFNQNSTPFDDIVKREAQNFLSQHSNKPIKQVLEISTGNTSIQMAGKFAKLSNGEQNLDDPAEMHVAVVDGLVKHHRAVHLKLASQKIIVAYFDQIDFLQLHSLMLSEQAQQFTLQNKHDASGKKDLYLISIEKDSGQLFNVLS